MRHDQVILVLAIVAMLAVEAVVIVVVNHLFWKSEAKKNAAFAVKLFWLLRQRRSDWR